MPHEVEIEDVFGAFPESMDFDTLLNDDGGTPNDPEGDAGIWALLETASADNDLEMVQEITRLKKLSRLGYFIDCALVAIQNDHSDVVAMLLQEGLPVDIGLVRRALHSSNKYHYLQLFVAAGWDVNTPLSPFTPSVLA